jgi:hypothetical protein
VLKLETKKKKSIARAVDPAHPHAWHPHLVAPPDTTWWRLLAALHVGASTALSLFASSIHAQTKKKKSIYSVDAFRSFSLAIPSVDRSPPFHAQTPSPSVHTATSPPSYE